MWVRNQDKNCLVDVKGCFIVNNCFYERHEYEIVGMCESLATCNQWSLGIYKTEKKVMKILDELQYRIARSESGVYQMPKDEE